MKLAEFEMENWVKAFLEEIERVEAFYLKIYEEYKNEFEILNQRYIQKNQMAESILSPNPMIQDIKSEISSEDKFKRLTNS